ncbi:MULTISPECIES: 6-phosphogluconolactonase [unclassified Leeuwenhoekiella]|uniref:6-phosphogluconolactonase n=1 Tax=unclassified Leeuwenhoekiella TaxID=2615029 RepID=UPI00048A9ECF|nr:6-phosphogluconolactonase [Leeuwenhoekiella sp. MAR_2009_132]
MDLRIQENKQRVAEDFSEFFKELCSTGEEVHIALSGGSTPKIVFDQLASEFGADIDWSKVNLYWGDERCVPPSDDESNYKMTVEHLLSKITIPEANIFRILGEDDPEKEAKRYTNVLRDNLPTLNGIPCFDLVILGMGDDGHTASIFPHQIELWEMPESCKVATHPESGQKRITITGKVINAAKTVAFLVTGASKKEKVSAIINEREDYKKFPASLVAPKNGELIWFLDQDAAAGL